MKARFIRLDWVIGSPLTLVQGVKNGKVPNGAVYGSNGSFMVNNNPSELWLVIETEDGYVCRLNIINTVRFINNWKRISKKRYNELKAKLNNVIFDIQDGKITNLAEAVKM